MPRRKREASSAVLEVPPCPRGHQGSQVVFGGFYGKPGQRRQMYRCTPSGGEKPHRFAPPLPRIQAPESACAECENPVHAHEGPRTGRQFSFSVRTIAESLGRVADGVSYQRVAAEVRSARSTSGQLVADWVEAFSGDLWDALGPKEWPNYLVCDTRPFYVRVPAATPGPVSRGRRGRGTSTPAFHVVSIVGAEGPTGRDGPWAWKPVLMVATPTLAETEWAQILGLLPGRPLAITTDEDTSLMNAVPLVWPDDPSTGEATPRINYCLYHLAEGFRASFGRAWALSNSNADDPRAVALWDAFPGLAKDPTQWLAFVDAVRGLGDPSATRWLNRLNRVQHVHDQLTHARRGEAHSNAAAEAELRWLGGQWAGRHGSYRNAGRTNRLLALMTLSRRGSYNRTRWAEIISTALEKRGGRPLTHLRSICDPYSQGAKPSLRP